MLLMFSVSSLAANSSLENIDFSTMPGEKIQIRFHFSQTAPKPNIFTIDTPSRLVMDFKQVSLKLEKKKQTIGVGKVRGIRAVESQGRMRVVLDLDSLVDYQIKQDGNILALTMNAGKNIIRDKNIVEDIDFRRGSSGEGHVIISFSNKIENISMQDEGDKIIVTMEDVKLPSDLERRLNVVDFATPVQMIDTFAMGKNVRMVIDAQGDYDHLGYQMNNQFTIEVKSLTEDEKKEKLKERFGYSGERLSLIFQDIEVRAVLQLIADFTGKNLVVSDTVDGNITLRLKNVPWDQALDIILKTRGLAMREVGNVIRIAPMEEIANVERQELENNKQIASLLPKVRETIQLNYRRATVVVGLLKEIVSEEQSKSESNTTGGELSGGTNSDTTGSESSASLASAALIGDDRTNKIIVYDTRENIEQLRKLIDEIDVPTKQVLIDSRIVSANDAFTRDMGVKWSSFNTRDINLPTGIYTGDDVAVNLAKPAAAASGIGVGISSAILGGGWLLDLELQAAQTDGSAEIVSSPRVVSANGETAMIRQGVRIPCQTVSQDGTETSFEDAVLSLQVTPNITPNNRVEMTVAINNDAQSGTTVQGQPIIDTQELTTNVIVNNGDTVVLGGVFKYQESDDTQKVPVLGDIPVLGRMFKSNTVTESKRELLIFITPKILNSELSLRQ